jgi:predicted amino acid dehydrogenase
MTKLFSIDLGPSTPSVMRILTVQLRIRREAAAQKIQNAFRWRIKRTADIKRMRGLWAADASVFNMGQSLFVRTLMTEKEKAATLENLIRLVASRC